MPSSKEALAAVKGLTQQRGYMYLSDKKIHEALLPQLPGLTFKQVRRAAARVRDPQRAVTTYGQESRCGKRRSEPMSFLQPANMLQATSGQLPLKAKQAEPCGIT